MKEIGFYALVILVGMVIGTLLNVTFGDGRVDIWDPARLFALGVGVTALWLLRRLLLFVSKRVRR